MKAKVIGMVTAVLLAAGAAQAAEEPYVVSWVRHLGTTAPDAVGGLTVDLLGNVYIAGQTQGTLGGPNAGETDAFLGKYDASGNLLWTRQLGTSADDEARGVAADAFGNAYITGNTFGSLGGPNSGTRDAFVGKYDASGNLLWTRQLGTSADDVSHGVGVDKLGNVYITGDTTGDLCGPNAGSGDAFVRKYDASGNTLWTRQFGTSSVEAPSGISVDPLGNAYITGTTGGALGGPNAGGLDAFLVKCDSSGNVLWTRQLGTLGTEFGDGVSVDSLGNVYITGRTSGNLGGPNAGSSDAFLGKYNTSGNVLWTRQLGTSGNDVSHGVAVDELGNIYIAGDTSGSLGGPNAGSSDAFLIKYDTSGNVLWTRQLGTSAPDWATAVALDSLGSAYIAGQTDGNLGGPNAGGYDAFLVKYVVPEPATLSLLALGGLALLKGRR